MRWDPSKGLTPPLCETRISLERVWLPAVLSAHSLSLEVGNFLNKVLRLDPRHRQQQRPGTPGILVPRGSQHGRFVAGHAQLYPPHPRT